VIEACGVRHEITVSTDQIARRPRIEHVPHPATVKKPGTSLYFSRPPRFLHADQMAL
jgi:hypothetical protein